MKHLLRVCIRQAEGRGQSSRRQRGQGATSGMHNAEPRGSCSYCSSSDDVVYSDPSALSGVHLAVMSDPHRHRAPPTHPSCAAQQWPKIRLPGPQQTSLEGGRRSCPLRTRSGRPALRRSLCTSRLAAGRPLRTPSLRQRSRCPGCRVSRPVGIWVVLWWGPACGQGATQGAGAPHRTREQQGGSWG